MRAAFAECRKCLSKGLVVPYHCRHPSEEAYEVDNGSIVLSRSMQIEKNRIIQLLSLLFIPVVINRDQGDEVCEKVAFSFE
jgi:hypothetical protein